MVVFTGSNPIGLATKSVLKKREVCLAGGPQDSTLELLLFTTCIGDIILTIKNSHFHLCADNLHIYWHFLLNDTERTDSLPNSDIDAVSPISLGIRRWLETEYSIHIKYTSLILLLQVDFETLPQLNNSVLDYCHKKRNLGLIMNRQVKIFAAICCLGAAGDKWAEH